MGSEHLFDCLQLLEPWFSAMMLVCSEIALVGSLLQVCQARERLSAISDALLRQPHQHLVQIRHASRAQASLSIALALANVVVMACCLRSSCDGVLFGQWAEAMAQNGSVREWPHRRVRLLLVLRAAFGLAAGMPALLELRRLVAPVIPLAAVAPYLGTRGFAV